jgi:hypothetical protein
VPRSSWAKGAGNASFTGAYVRAVAHDLSGQGWQGDATRFEYEPLI